MLGERYRYTGEPYLNLNELQITVKQAVDRKVKDGRYRFEAVSCAVCGSNSFKCLAERDRYGLYMPVAICKRCGLVQTNPRMTQESYNEFYNEEYRNLYGGGMPESSTPEGFFAGGYTWKGPHIYDYLAKNGLLPPASPETLVVEVGCGAGGILHFFREKGMRVKGVDLGEEFVSYGRTHYGLDIKSGTLADLDLDQAPTLILYRQVFEHILDLSAELDALRAIADARCRIYIELPGIKALENYNRDLLQYLQNAHTYHFSLRSLCNMMSNKEFELVRGDEVVRSVFVAHSRSTHQVSSDYKEVMSYLKSEERMLRPSPLTKAFRKAKAALPNPVRTAFRKAKAVLKGGTTAPEI